MLKFKTVIITGLLLLALRPFPVGGRAPASVKADQAAVSPRTLISFRDNHAKAKFLVDNQLKLKDLRYVPELKAYLYGASNKLAYSDGVSLHPDVAYHVQQTPNDPLYPSQTAFSQINAAGGWDTTTGSSATIIAVIDTGFALSQQDLASKWWTNAGEIGPTSQQGPAPNCTSRGLPLDKSCNNLDNDGDGLASDWRGWDFVDSSNDVSAGKTNPLGAAVNHGTGTSALAAAAANDGKGIAGMCWQCLVMPLQALDDSGSGDTISVASAVTYATDHGASVINLSLGSTTDDPVLHAAINYALAKNVVVVAAAGNTGAGTLQYPAAYAGVVSVGATDQNHKLASFSGITSVLSVLAPGVNVLTDSWSQGNQTTATAIESGTSFSTAIVSGLAGLMRSAQASTNTAQLLDALQTGGVSLSYNGRSFNEVNAANALQALGVPPGGLENVSRLFNPGLGTHFFTIDPTERDIAISQLGFRLEGDAFIGYPTAVNGYVPVFRLYNVQSHQHFYTADASEATIVQTQLGYRMDGVGFYASSQAGLNLHPVYRLLQQHTGEHFYTTSLSERSALASQGWNPEGVAWYGY